jgi:hypothetical protein
MSQSLWLRFLIFFCSATAFGQNQTDACILGTAKNGQTIAVRGSTVQEPHDLVFDIAGCNDGVVLTFAGYSDNDVGTDQLRQDGDLKDFQKYTSSTYKRRGKHICLQCAKYGNVNATLTGKLEIATIPPGTTKDSLGFVHDASGKIVGASGFGHPTRIFKYRLVILSASDVTAVKLPRPDAVSPDDPKPPTANP